MSDKRVYWQTVLKWGTATGVVGVSAVALLFMFLISAGAIEVASSSHACTLNIVFRDWWW